MPFAATAVTEASAFSILEDVKVRIVDFMRHDAAFAPAAVIGNAAYRVHLGRSLGNRRGNPGFGRTSAEIADSWAFGAFDLTVQIFAVAETPACVEMVE